VFLLCFIFLSFIGADVSAHRAFLSWSDHRHLLSIFCTFVIEQIHDDEMMMMMMTTARPVKCRPVKWHPVICRCGQLSRGRRTVLHCKLVSG